MEGIPPAIDTDVEDVVWALQTAEALWKRNERGDAIVWLRRAAQAAGEVNDDDRAFSLARHAADLTEWLARSAPPAAHTLPPSSEPTSAGLDIDSLLQSSHVDPSEITWGRTSPPPLPTLVQNDRDEPPAPVADDEPPDTEPPVDFESMRPPVSIRVPSAAESHAGMLDPWSEGEEKKRAEPGVPEASASATREPDSDDEVVTSAGALPVVPEVALPPLPLAHPAASVVPRPPKPAPPRSLAKPPAPPRPSSLPLTSSSVPPRRSKLPARARTSPPAPPVSETPPLSATLATPATEREVIPAGAAVTPAVPSVEQSPLDPLDLSQIEAFSDLPDDAREALARAARVRRCAKGEALGDFALAFVVTGDVDVSASDVRVVATTIGAGGVLRARGSLDEPIPLRLVCASNAVVATWDGEAMQVGLGPCPWVEDDLRAAGDRVQALAGATFGSLGQRLSVELRTSIVDRLAIRIFAEHEAVVTEGVSVPGLLLVGAGKVKLVSDDAPPTEVGAGQFVLAAEAMSAGASPATVRAAHGGALVLIGDRKTTQELFATEPLLLEIFAGW